MKLNKSYLTNGIAMLLVAASFATQGEIHTYLLYTGMFALSGSLTNTIAIHMLFNKVPFLYGSGVILVRFEAFKEAVASMVMKEFFTLEHIEKFTNAKMKKGVNLTPIIDKVNFEPAFSKLVGVIMDSSFGGMLGMFGGEKALYSFKEPFEKRMKEAVIEIAEKPNFQALIQNHLVPKDAATKLLEQIEIVVLARLEELTPQMVKEMIEKIIKEHLGWLVIWGGFFGGVIGLVSAVLL